MSKLWCATCFFVAGGNFERFLNGEPDSFFGVYWLLPIYAICGVLVGWSLIPTRYAVTRPDRGGDEITEDDQP